MYGLPGAEGRSGLKGRVWLDSGNPAPTIRADKGRQHIEDGVDEMTVEAAARQGRANQPHLVAYESSGIIYTITKNWLTIFSTQHAH